MKRLIQLAFLGLLTGFGLAGQAWGVIAFQQAGAFTANAASCSMTTGVTIAGDDLVVVASIRTTTSTVTSVTDDAANTYAQRAAINNGTSARVEIWSAQGTASVTATITVNLSASSKVVCAFAEYSGVAALGTTATSTGSTADPTISLTTQDNNNWVVGGFAHNANTNATAKTANLRATNSTAGGAAGTNVGGALTDQTAATPSSVTNDVTWAAAAWAAAALELRSTTGAAPKKRLPLLGVG